MLKVLFLIRKIGRIIRKLWIYFLVYILKVKINQTENINGIKLTINALEKGGQAYLNRGSYQEVIDPLYKLIQQEYNPDVVIDVGANYGFISVLYAKIFKQSKVIAIEPGKWLCKYIELNKKSNNCDNIEIIQAICDEVNGDTKGFSMNPVHSQDNRVEAPSSLWRKENIITTSIDAILEKEGDFRSTFIKIDTQGFEKSVLNGASNYLKQNSNWLIKMEFFPDCLRKQGTDPNLFLKYLVDNFDVVDIPAILNYKEDSISNLFKNKFNSSDVDSFIDYIVNFNHSQIGWVDLLIRSKS